MSTASQNDQDQSSNNEFRNAFDALHAPLLRFLMAPEDPAPVAALALISAPLASTAPLLVAALLGQRGQNNQQGQKNHQLESAALSAPVTQEIQDIQKIQNQVQSMIPLVHAPVEAVSEVAQGIQKIQDEVALMAPTDHAPAVAFVTAAQESRKNKRSHKILSEDRSKKACFIAQSTVADLQNGSSPVSSLSSVFKVPAPPTVQNESKKLQNVTSPLASNTPVIAAPTQLPSTQSPLTTPPPLSNFAVLKAVISNFSSPYEVERRYNPRMGITKKEFEELEKMMKKKADIITHAVRYNTRIDILEYQNKIKALEKENEKLKAQLEEKKEGGQ